MGTIYRSSPREMRTPMNRILKSTLVLALAMCLLPAVAHAQDSSALARGHVFYASDFESADALKEWPGAKATLEAGCKGGHALCIQRPAGSERGSAMVRKVLPVEKMRGYVVFFSAMVKAEKVSQRPQSWNGVKFMAPMVMASGKSWPAAKIDVGTFDWQRVAFRVAVPEDAKELSLCLGLELVSGKAWFDDVRVTVGKRLPSFTPRAVSGPVYKGHDLPRLRGAMIRPTIDEASLRVLGQEWGANVLRWQLIRHRPIADPLDRKAYDQWLQAALKQMDAALPLCEKYGLRVVVDLHSPPGGRPTVSGYVGSDHGLFSDAASQRHFVEIWQHMARRYKDTKCIWGYDLANEPVEDGADENLADWQELAERTARAIREIDPQRAIIVEPAHWGGPDGLRELRPLDVPNVVYSVHMYIPGSFTHQGVHGSSEPRYYPGKMEGREWNKAQLEAALKPVIDFQKAYGVHIYIGEFSAIRWAPDNSAYRYLRDLIDIFEAHGWDWTYHAFREWDGWSVEHGPDRNDRSPSKTPTDREKLLRQWFGKNVHR